MIHSEEEYIAHLEHCFPNAKIGRSNLTEQILDIEGTSGKKFRHLSDNILGGKNLLSHIDAELMSVKLFQRAIRGTAF